MPHLVLVDRPETAQRLWLSSRPLLHFAVEINSYPMVHPVIIMSQTSRIPADKGSRLWRMSINKATKLLDPSSPFRPKTSFRCHTVLKNRPYCVRIVSWSSNRAIALLRRCFRSTLILFLVSWTPFSVSRLFHSFSMTGARLIPKNRWYRLIVFAVMATVHGLDPCYSFPTALCATAVTSWWRWLLIWSHRPEWAHCSTDVQLVTPCSITASSVRPLYRARKFDHDFVGASPLQILYRAVSSALLFHFALSLYRVHLNDSCIDVSQRSWDIDFSFQTILRLFGGHLKGTSRRRSRTESNE